MCRLDFCGIGDVGACLLGKALTLNAGLGTVTLSNNSFAAKGAESIVDCLEANASIHTLRCLHTRAVVCRIMMR
jgi:hypothetical protein